jgi:hypothetical protein
MAERLTTISFFLRIVTLFWSESAQTKCARSPRLQSSRRILPILMPHARPVGRAVKVGKTRDGPSKGKTAHAYPSTPFLDGRLFPALIECPRR